MYRGIRKRSPKTLCGLPLVDIAIGPDPEKGEMRGHAHGIIAIGDIANLQTVVPVSANQMNDCPTTPRTLSSPRRRNVTAIVGPERRLDAWCYI